MHTVNTLEHGSVAEFDHPPYSQGWYETLRERLGEITCRNLGIYAIPDSFVLSVIMPVYNEAETLQHSLARVCQVPIRKEIVIVDDGSTDNSVHVLRQLDGEFEDEFNTLRVLSHPRNYGKGRALRTGFAAATGDVVIVQDADLEYDPTEYSRLLAPIIDGRADVVYGSRFLGDYPHRVLYYWHYLGNRFLTMLSNCFTNLNLTDMETCYKLFRREVIEEIAPKLKENRFGFEPEVTARLSRTRYRVYEMSVSYAGRSYEEGKKIGWRDGISALWCILRYALAN